MFDNFLLIVNDNILEIENIYMCEWVTKKKKNYVIQDLKWLKDSFY